MTLASIFRKLSIIFKVYRVYQVIYEYIKAEGIIPLGVLDVGNTSHPDRVFPSVSLNNLNFFAALKKKLGVTNERLIIVTAQMEGVDLQICSSKVKLAKACFKGFCINFVFLL